jgi:hypothetical protein
MNALFELYDTYLKRRIHFVTSFTAFGEDSIRYDFYAALLRLYNLEPHQLYLEHVSLVKNLLTRRFYFFYDL